MKKTFIAYVAGIIDGEGTLLINKHIFKNNPSYHTRYVPMVRINMCDPTPVKMIQKEFGGSIFINKVSKKNVNWRDTFMWIVGSFNAIKFLKIIYPFLVIKKGQADILFRLYQNIQSGRKSRSERKSRFLTDEIMKEREKLFQEIKILKRISV